MAKSTFAILQRVAMVGHGAAIVNGVVVDTTAASVATGSTFSANGS